MQSIKKKKKKTFGVNSREKWTRLLLDSVQKMLIFGVS